MARMHEYDPDKAPVGTRIYVEMGKQKAPIREMLTHLMKEDTIGDVWWGYTNPDIDVVVLALVFSDPNSAFEFKMKYV